MRQGEGREDTRRKRQGRFWLVASAFLGLGAAAAVPVGAAAASTPTVLTVLHVGTSLLPGQAMVSKDGQYRLTFLKDGNLLLTDNNKLQWMTRTYGHPGARSGLAHGGIFGIAVGKKSLFATPAYSEHGEASYMFVKDSGNVVICNGQGKILWSINRPPTLQEGDAGTAVLALQRRLAALGYWLGNPDGQFADSTQQAVWAFQKAAGQTPDGVVGPAAWSALDRGVVPVPRKAGGNLIEVDLNKDLVMILRHGKLWVTLNTSTGGGYTYSENGVTSVAITPQGHYTIYAEINGSDTDPLGTLWRPKFFTGGYAIHGDSFVPPYPVSHGCVRISDEAINWIWADNVAPIGTAVWVY